jgi:2-hydroxychromene-2-carboxylate isomerase
MDRSRVRIYTDYKCPYAFVAQLFELEEAHGAELEWLPYTLRIPEFMGTVEERTPHFWRKVRYAYMDARRYAAGPHQGPRRIYDAFYFSAGMLFAQRHGLFRPYHDTVFHRFWSHDLEIDDRSDISRVIASIGGSAEAFEAYVHGPAGPSTTASSTKRKRSVYSACRRWSSTANCSGAAITSTC